MWCALDPTLAQKLCQINERQRRLGAKNSEEHSEKIEVRVVVRDQPEVGSQVVVLEMRPLRNRKEVNPRNGQGDPRE